MVEVVDQIQVLSVEPEGFSPWCEVVGAYVEVGNEVLFLKRAHSEAGLWGIPAGKVEEGESTIEAVERELKEETGICHSHLEPYGRLYIRKPLGDYVFHLFHMTLEEKPEVILSEEHLASHWLAPHEANHFPFMAGAFEAYLHFKTLSANRARKGANVNAYLLLKKEDQVLLHLRKNTGYYDDHYGLVSGHIEDGESASLGLIREAGEEAGIQIRPENLRFVHCLHRQTNRLNVDLFFECDEWEGEVTNMEPEKCAALEFHDIHDLPPNTVGYVEKTIQCFLKKEFYSELGWNK